jgi:hypothetical protein
MAMILKKHEWISEIDGKPIAAHAYCFSPEEQADLRKFLKKHEEPKIEAFMRCIEVYVDYTRRILDRSNLRNRAAHRDKLSALRRRCEATYKDILQICSGRFQVLPPHQCDPADWNFQDTGNPRVKIRREIAFATAILSTPEYLQKIIENLTSALEIEKVKRGEHYKADEFLLAFQIAQSFKKYIGMPRPYAGPFSGICKYCFDIIGMKMGERKNMQRTINAALKKLASAAPAKAI